MPSFYKDKQGRIRPITKRKRKTTHPRIRGRTSLSPEAEMAAGAGVIAAVPLPPGTDPTDVIGVGMIADGARRKHNQRKVRKKVKGRMK